MPSEQSKHTELADALNWAGRELSAATVLFHTAIAERLGLNTTDHKCADILAQTGAITAGELAERTGLTTGAITGVVDRLEKAGFVRRERDPAIGGKLSSSPSKKRWSARLPRCSAQWDKQWLNYTQTTASKNLHLS
ncbi:MarR family transcriptional regulator [Chlorogloeopsis fritschii PCC 9212]